MIATDDSCGQARREGEIKRKQVIAHHAHAVEFGTYHATTRSGTDEAADGTAYAWSDEVADDMTRRGSNTAFRCLADIAGRNEGADGATNTSASGTAEGSTGFSGCATDFAKCCVLSGQKRRLFRAKRGVVFERCRYFSAFAEERWERSC